MMPTSISRGQAQDLLAKFAAENPKYREALIKDPKSVLEKQFGKPIGKGVTVKAVVESAETLYVIVPHVAGEGELQDADLEKVAGGFADKYTVNCGDGAFNSLNQVSL
jgi:hypothetical protein